VDVERRAESKVGSTPRFCLVLLDRRGGEHDVVCYERSGDASAERDRLSSYLGAANVAAYELEASKPGVATALLLLAVALFLLVSGSALAHAGKLQVRIDHESNELEVVWTLFGFRRARRTFALDTVADVRTEPGPVSIRLYRPAQAGARLAFAMRGRRRAEPVTHYLPQVTALRRAVDEIRGALGVVDPEPELAPKAAEPERSPRGVVEPELAPEAPPPEASAASVTQASQSAVGRDAKPVAKKRSFEDVFGLRPDSPVALVVGVVLFSIGAALFEWWSERSGGTVEFYAESRCVFGVSTLLPGGSMSTSLRPGRYSVSVFNPDVPGNYESLAFEVTRGQTTSVRCRATPRVVH
jgi:hypothetical protein